MCLTRFHGQYLLLDKSSCSCISRLSGHGLIKRTILRFGQAGAGDGVIATSRWASQGSLGKKLGLVGDQSRAFSFTALDQTLWQHSAKDFTKLQLGEIRRYRDLKFGRLSVLRHGFWRISPLWQFSVQGFGSSRLLCCEIPESAVYHRNLTRYILLHQGLHDPWLFTKAVIENMFWKLKLESVW